MANGTNGNNVYDPADTNPISPWIKPGFSALAGIVALWLIVVSALAAITAGNWVLVGGLIGVLLIYVGWYYGQRNQDKAVSVAQSAFMSGFQTALPIQPPAPSPQNGGQTSQVTQVVTPGGGQAPIAPWQGLPVTPQPAPQPVPPPQTFNEAQFDAEITAAIQGQYGVVNDATKFYEAWRNGAVRYGDPPRVRFSSQDPAWVAYLRKLVNRYFSFEWGLKDDAGNLLETGALEYAIAHINDEKGCATCGGKELAKCPWTSIQQKADYMGTPGGPYSMALQNYHMVELYVKGMYFIA
jgi:hypothetical protein